MSYSSHVYLHGYCSLFIPYFNIIFVQYKNNFFSLFFFSLLSLSNTNVSHQVSASLSLFHSWALPLIFSLRLLLISFYSFSSPRAIMWSIWGFCSPVRRVDQLIDSSFLLTDFGANFSKKVWVFVIEIVGCFCLLVSSKILGSFSKVRFEFTVWISKLWLLGKKKKMTVGRRHRFDSISWVTDSSNTVVGDINSAAIVRATITTIGPPVMVVQWSKTPIRWAVTKATMLVVWASAAFVEAAILTIHLPVGHYSAIQWAARPIQRRLLEPLFWQFSHRTSTTSSSIGRATGISSLLKI